MTLDESVSPELDTPARKLRGQRSAAAVPAATRRLLGGPALDAGLPSGESLRGVSGAEFVRKPPAGIGTIYPTTILGSHSPLATKSSFCPGATLSRGVLGMALVLTTAHTALLRPGSPSAAPAQGDDLTNTQEAGIDCFVA